MTIRVVLTTVKHFCHEVLRYIISGDLTDDQLREGREKLDDIEVSMRKYITEKKQWADITQELNVRGRFGYIVRCSC